MVKAKITSVKAINKDTCKVVATDLDSLHTSENGPNYEIETPLYRIQRMAEMSGCSEGIEGLVGKTLLIDSDSMIMAIFHAEDFDKLSIIGGRRTSDR